MLSYLHGFHAGNFADVHKHVALTHLLRLLTRKESPLAYLDTHAGRGCYDLKAPAAQQTAEFASGIGRLWSQTTVPTLLADYLDAVKRFNPDGGLHVYPGSPAIARELLRAQDRALLCELHPAEVPALKALFSGDGRIAVHRRDALEGLRALTPPKENRGLALIDPSYEMKNDYIDVARALHQARQRWRTGVFMVWYPILAEARHQALLDTVLNSGQRKVLRSELRLPAGAHRPGMLGSGLLIANPPWKFEEMLSEAVAELAVLLGDPACGHEWGWLLAE